MKRILISLIVVGLVALIANLKLRQPVAVELTTAPNTLPKFATKHPVQSGLTNNIDSHTNGTAIDVVHEITTLKKTKSPRLSHKDGELVTASEEKDLPPGLPKPTMAKAKRPAVEAVVLEEDGKVFENGTEDEARRFEDIVKNRRDTASKELLDLFQSEKDTTTKEEILSAASSLAYDEHIRAMLLLALSLNEPAELRLEAVAHLSQRDRNLLLTYQSDPDQNVREEVNGLLDEAQMPPESNVIGKNRRPPIAPPTKPRLNSNHPK